MANNNIPQIDSQLYSDEVRTETQRLIEESWHKPNHAFDSRARFDGFARIGVVCDGDGLDGLARRLSQRFGALRAPHSSECVYGAEAERLPPSLHNAIVVVQGKTPVVYVRYLI